MAELIPDITSEAVASLFLSADALRVEEEYERFGCPGGPDEHRKNMESLRKEQEVWQFIEGSAPQVTYMPPRKRRRKPRQPDSGLAEVTAMLGKQQDIAPHSCGPHASVCSLDVTSLVHAAESSHQCAMGLSQDLPVEFGKKRAAVLPRRKRFLHGGDLGAWRKAGWDAERARRTLVIARLRKGATPASVSLALTASGVVSPGPELIRLRAEGGSKRGRERAIAFVEFPCEQAMRETWKRLGNSDSFQEHGWVVDKARRGVDSRFVPHRFQGRYFWNKVPKCSGSSQKCSRAVDQRAHTAPTSQPPRPSYI